MFLVRAASGASCDTSVMPLASNSAVVVRMLEGSPSLVPNGRVKTLAAHHGCGQKAGAAAVVLMSEACRVMQTSTEVGSKRRQYAEHFEFNADSFCIAHRERRQRRRGARGSQLRGYEPGGARMEPSRLRVSKDFRETRWHFELHLMHTTYIAT